jgi:Xaa-Pro aminopeptidase
METKQPALKNGRNVWDRINMPLQEFQERLLKVRAKMKEKRIDLLLAYGHAFNEYGNPCYLTNYQMRLPRGTLVAVPEKRDLALFFEGAARGLPSARLLTWVEDIRPCADISRACTQYLKEKGLSAGSIALAGLEQWMPRYQLKYLLDAFAGSKILPADDILQQMRMVKSPRETDQIRRASRIVRQVFEFLGRASFATMKERIVEALLIREARMEGAEDVRVLLGRPQEAPWALGPAQDRILEPGRTLIVYTALAFERYWSEGIRTLTVGENAFLSPDLADLQALRQRAADCVKAGKPISQCRKEITDEIQKAGKVWIVTHGLGQGIGLSLQEGPFFQEENVGSIQEGMALSLRLCVRDENEGAVMVGDTYSVSRAGLEGLTF